jgi:hypothetical protein
MRPFIFALFLIVLSCSICKAQDTIVLLNGNKILSIKTKIQNEILYKNENDTSKKWHSIDKLDIDYIGFAKGYKIVYRFRETDSINHEKAKKAWGSICLNAGVGGSLMTLAVLPILYSPQVLTETPAYNATLDYRIISWLSIGAAIAYQSFTDIPEYGFDPAYWEVEKISRLNISGRLLYHLTNARNVDCYLGMRIGSSSWKDSIQSTGTTAPRVYTCGNFVRGSFQALVGARIFIFYNLGVHFEGGIGTPYLLEGGLTLRVNTRKNEK